MKDTKIQWTDHTWNIAVGCTKVDEDCKYCYMYRGSLNNTRYDPKTVRKTKTVFNLPLKIKEPSRIFVSSLTDVFHPECDSFREEMWDIIRKCPQHTFQILTKRPERIAAHLPEDWANGWDNVWLGTSVGGKAGLDRMAKLATVTAKTRFLSLEPLHESILLENVMFQIMNNYFRVLSLYHWVIVGGESGNDTGKYRYRPCELAWIEKIVVDCKRNRTPVFVKQLGTHLARELRLKDRHGGDMEEWPEELRVREFPRPYWDMQWNGKLINPSDNIINFLKGNIKSSKC